MQEKIKSALFENVAGSVKRRRKHTIDEKDRKQAWDFCFGEHKKEASCPMCESVTLKFTDRGGWECGHIVAEQWCPDLRSKYYLLPCCAGCNKETTTRCILDVLWERGRFNTLKQLCTRVFNTYSEQFPDKMEQLQHKMWKLVRYLYGSENNKCGGGISTALESHMYNMLLSHQTMLLQKEVYHLCQQQHKCIALIEQLAIETAGPDTINPRLFA